MVELKGAQKAALLASQRHFDAGNRDVDGFGFWLEQGLGKTLTTLADFSEFVARGVVSRMVVFCPNSFKGGWAAEIEKWGMPLLPLIYTPDGEKYIRAAMRKGFNQAPVLIINYESVRTEKGQALIRDFSEGKNVYGAADESIQIKDPDSAQTKAVLEMGKLFRVTRSLSGKPQTQGPHDLWAQMRFIKQLEGFRFYPFKNAFCQMGGFKMKQVIGAQNEDVLAERIDPHVFRATKADWTDLPPKVYSIREYEMSPEMKAMYRQMEQEFILWLNDGDNVSVDAAITKYIKLAQIQCGFILDEDKKVHMLVPPERNPRLRLIKSLFEDEVVGKTTIVYNNRVVFDMLMEAFAKYNPTYIRGQMDPASVEEQKRIFNTDWRSRIMLLQTKAAKYGHTLLGLPERENHCSTQIFYQNTYSLDDRSQIEDRSHRYGQLGESMLYLDLVGTPLDRDAVRALQRKEGLFQAVFSLLRRSSPASAS